MSFNGIRENKILAKFPKFFDAVCGVTACVHILMLTSCLGRIILYRELPMPIGEYVLDTLVLTNLAPAAPDDFVMMANLFFADFWRCLLMISNAFCRLPFRQNLPFV